jgi:hypothetical protein
MRRHRARAAVTWADGPEGSWPVLPQAYEQHGRRERTVRKSKQEGSEDSWPFLPETDPDQRKQPGTTDDQEETMDPEQISQMTDDEYEEYIEDRDQWSARRNGDGEYVTPLGEVF